MKTKIKERIEKIDKALDLYIPVQNNEQGIIYESMRYSLFAGGKRLRPILMLESAKLCGADEDMVMPFACAMEMIHTYSLIHDDLPAMDNDDLRRGMPTNHIKFGEATAILAGDSLLTKAFEITSAVTDITPEKAIKAISMLAASAGTEGMIGGQVIDMEYEGKKITLDTLKKMHLLKTGAIIRSSCKIGALLAGGAEQEIEAVDDFASNLGIAFQIRDDILDVEGDTATLGKNVGSDIASDKNTYTKLMSLDEAKRLVGEYSERAKAALSIFGERAKFLLELTDYLSGRNN